MNKKTTTQLEERLHQLESRGAKDNDKIQVKLKRKIRKMSK